MKQKVIHVKARRHLPAAEMHAAPKPGALCTQTLNKTRLECATAVSAHLFAQQKKGRFITLGKITERVSTSPYLDGLDYEVSQFIYVRPTYWERLKAFLHI